jgi:hypothetical protein
MTQGRPLGAGWIVRRLRHLVRDPRGQAVTEYIALAGVLVVTGLLVSGILGRGLRAFVNLVTLNVRTIAP